MPASGPHVGGVLLSRRPGIWFSYNRELPVTAELRAWDSGSVITENLPSLLSRRPGTGSVMIENLLCHC